MIELEFEINGKPVSINNVSNIFDKSIMESAIKHITKSVGAIQCPQHNAIPKIVAYGNDFSNLRFKVSACCQNLIDKITLALC